MASLEPVEFQISGPSELRPELSYNLRRQVVLLGEDAVTIFEKKGGKILSQFRISEIVQAVFHPIRFGIGGAKYRHPFGLILLARNWDEQRLGVRSIVERGKDLRGVYFAPEGGLQAEAFFEQLLSRETYKPQRTPYVKQVFADRFTVSLTQNELIINHIPLLNHRIYGGGNEEVRCFISEISGVKLEVKGLRSGTSDEDYGTLWFLNNLNREQRVNPIARLEKSPWALTFPTSMKETMADLSEFVRQRIADTRQSSSSSSVPSLAEEIKKLAELVEQGLISNEEFESGKRKLLEN